MATGRPLKYTPERAQIIIERLRTGATRRAAYLSAGVTDKTFAGWLRRFSDFSDAVTHAEAEAELLNTAILRKAAAGWDAGEKTRTVKTVFRTRKTHYPDGRVIEEPVALEEVTESSTERREFDWRAALEWLKRRRRDEWGDNQTVTFLQKLAREVEGMEDGDLLQFLGYDGRGDPGDPAATGTRRGGAPGPDSARDG